MTRQVGSFAARRVLVLVGLLTSGPLGPGQLDPVLLVSVRFRRNVEAPLLLLLRLQDQVGDRPKHLLHVDVLLCRSLEQSDFHLQ